MLFPEKARLRRGRAAVISCPDPDCKRCVSACGFSAISMDEEGRPVSDPEKCVGCGGCAAICPMASVRLFKDRGDGTFEVTFPYSGELPELGDTIPLSPLPGGAEAQVRVLQVIPKRPNAENALVRAAVDEDALFDYFA